MASFQPHFRCSSGSTAEASPQCLPRKSSLRRLRPVTDCLGPGLGSSEYAPQALSPFLQAYLLCPDAGSRPPSEAKQGMLKSDSRILFSFAEPLACIMARQTGSQQPPQPSASAAELAAAARGEPKETEHGRRQHTTRTPTHPQKRVIV